MGWGGAGGEGTRGREGRAPSILAARPQRSAAIVSLSMAASATVDWTGKEAEESLVALIPPAATHRRIRSSSAHRLASVVSVAVHLIVASPRCDRASDLILLSDEDERRPGQRRLLVGDPRELRRPQRSGHGRPVFSPA